MLPDGINLLLVAVAIAPVADCVHAGGDDLVGIPVLRREDVARKLVGDELIVRQVFVKRRHHPIAVAPGVEDVALLAGAA